VIVILIVSLVEALFILPSHLGHLSEKKSRNKLVMRLESWQESIARAFKRFIENYYGPLLDFCLKYRYITLSAALALLLIVGGYGLSDHMGMILMPEVAADEIEAGVTLPVGTTPYQAQLTAEEITRSTRRMFEEYDLHEVAEGIKTNIRGQNFIDVEIVMRPPDQREMTARELIELWRENIGDIEGVDQITFEAERGPGGYLQEISVDLSHSGIDVLGRAGAAFL
jgi:multidrug efflux pump subunit AcrB